MEIYDINKLKFRDGFADLTESTFIYNTEIINSTSTIGYIVQRGEEMRVDLISDSIYNNVDNVDILCNYNNIDNPLNFKEGEFIEFPIESSISELRYTDTDLQEDELISQSPSKTTRKDPTRKDYISNNQSLPPTQLDKRISPLNTNGNQLSIGDGLF
jgi:hypothetical protein